jgi:hypothetical protein
MVFTGIFLATLTGFLLINNISPKFNLCEKIGLAFPVGIFCVTMLMLLMDAVNIPLKENTILVGMIMLLVIVALLLSKKYIEIFSELKKSLKISIGNYNMIWALFIILIIYVENMNFQKCMFWPPFDRDSIAGFETIGYVISKEFTLKGLSIFQQDYITNIRGAGSYITYTPLVQLSYGFIYLFGAETSKIIPGLMYASFLLAFYGVSKRVINKTGAAIITFFVLITPEMIAFSSLSMTNVIHAVFASLTIIYLTIWFRERHKYDLFLSALLLAINLFCRTEGIVFVAAAFAVLFIDMWITKYYKEYALFALIALSTIIIWNIFMKINGISAESIAITKPFWDSEKMSIIWKYMVSLFTSTQYYGVTFIVFVVGLLGNVWFMIKKRNNIYLLSMILLAMILYMVLLYHIDYKWDSIENVLMYSAKRFMFCFIPLLWFYAASTKPVLWFLNKTEDFLSVKK